MPNLMSFNLRSPTVLAQYMFLSSLF